MKKKDVHILIIDDDETVRSSLVEAVKKFGYSALAASNTNDALSVIRIKSIHAAIVDCMLPKMNGIESVKKLRESRFGDSVVVMMSGIFKDKSFATDTIEKTEAVDFLFKPIELNRLRQILDEHLEPLCSETTIPLHALISKGYESSRERRKAIEMLEQISGFDLPFVLSVLMDAKVSGHLNIVNNAGEIYGITLCKGLITTVDSSESVATLTLLLLQKGYVTPGDLSALGEKTKKGDILKALLSEALISPHTVPIVRNEQIMTDLKRLFTDEMVQFNFAPERMKEDLPGVSLDMLIPYFQVAIQDFITMDYLCAFYDGWGDYAILEGPSYSQAESLSEFDLIKRAQGIAAVAHEMITINELITSDRYSKEDLLKALHLLTLKRVIIFDTVKRGMNNDNVKTRFTHMLHGVEKKNPKQIFIYFGASVAVKKEEVERIYKEFAKNNHPDKLPKDASKELLDLNNRVFSVVSEAHQTLFNP
ncbi:MAG: response regulator, partial [Bdellovibrionales bacterium]|nr:response regulator [Bdellovibrionales bacterium]